MYDTIASQFADAMQREGKTIYSHTDNTAYTVLFRTNSDKNTMQDKLTIFYSTSQNITQGQLLKYKNKTYIALNQETPENDVYYKSDLLETNASIYLISNGIETDLPIYAYDISSPMAISSTTISVVSGNVHMITQYNETSKKLAINNTFDSIGRTWEIQNIVVKDNIVHLYCEVQATSNTYALSISANDSYGINTTSQLTAKATYGSTTITNAIIQWTSSDISVATIDSTGKATFIKQGSVTITALWSEHNVSATKSITVNAYSVTITANDTYSTADTPTLTATASVNSVSDTSATFTWSSSDTTKATVTSAGVVTFLSAGSVTISATWTQQNAIGTKSIVITQAVTNTADITYKGTSSAIYIGGSTAKVYTGAFYDSTGAAITLTPVWSISAGTVATTGVSLVTQIDAMQIGLKADSTASVGTIKLNLKDSNNTCSKSIDITIKSLL